MNYEVELKFPITDLQTIQEKLESLGAVYQETISQHDRYFNHPSRDFAQTDEAVRIRSVGEQNRITYKGPVLDAQTKTRHEIEVPFEPGNVSQTAFAEILTKLGFRAVYDVKKSRQVWELKWEERELELALDQVENLGEFLEIEALASEEERDAARDSILRLAEKLGFGASERRSYLRLLLEKMGLE